MKKVLLVEGADDVQTILGLLDVYKLESGFNIMSCDGKDNLMLRFDAMLKNPSAYSVIGVVLDADENAGSRWQQVRDRLTKTGFYLCRKMPLDNQGMIIEGIDTNVFPKVGIWIMPDNRYCGTLENFLLDMIDKDDELLGKVEEVLTDIETLKIKRYRNIDRNKAKVHTFLSWEKKPGKSLRTEIVSRVLNPKTDTATNFINWLKRLYSIA